MESHLRHFKKVGRKSAWFLVVFADEERQFKQRIIMNEAGVNFRANFGSGEIVFRRHLISLF